MSVPEKKRIYKRTITSKERLLCGFIGLMGFGTGGTALFLSENQAGTVAVLTIGAIASMFSLIGAVPLRWVIAGNEMDLSEEEETVLDNLADQVGPQARATLAHSLAQSGLSAHSPAMSRLLLASTTELAGMDLVRNVVEGLRGWKTLPPYGLGKGRPRVDGLVAAPNGTRIAIEVKTSGRSLPTLLDRVPEILEGSQTEGLLVVIGQDLPPGSRRDWNNGDERVRVVAANDFELLITQALLALAELGPGASPKP